MPRYTYRCLEVTCLEPRRFPLDRMRDAVDHLKSLPPHDERFIGLSAIADSVPAGQVVLGPKPMLGLSKIIGRTPAEVWELFDKQIDESVASMKRRLGYGPER